MIVFVLNTVQMESAFMMSQPIVIEKNTTIIIIKYNKEQSITVVYNSKDTLSLTFYNIALSFT